MGRFPEFRWEKKRDIRCRVVGHVSSPNEDGPEGNIPPQKADRITVYSDAQSASRQLQATDKEGQAIITQITKQARQLQSNGGEVIVRWILKRGSRAKKALLYDIKCA